MTEALPVLSEFDVRVAAHKKRLADSPIAVLLELAATVPGGDHDFPSAPIDTSLYAAARALVSEAQLQEQLAASISA